MGGKGSGQQTSVRAKRLPRTLRPGWMKRMDQRFRVARQLNERLAGVGTDLGGLEQLTTIERAMVERFIHTDALASQIEERARSGQAFDVGQYLTVVDRVLRIGQVLGTQRRARPLPRALEYAAQVAANGQEARER